MAHTTQQSPIMLSICIPAYSRQEQLAHNLDQMKWIIDADIAIEIVISDDASVDDSERVIQEKGRMFPRFRYVRQPRNVGPEGNFIAVMRLARGKFFVELADDDRLIPEALLAEIDYMNEHDDIIANHAPWLVWSDITKTDHGLFYHLDKPVDFGKAQSAELFNFIVTRGVFPEHAICRTESFTKVLFKCHGVLKEVIWNFRALDYGRVRFQPKPWLLHVGDSPIRSFQQKKLGIEASLTQLDQYRGALEMAASIAMSNVGMTDFNPGNRAVVMDMINSFITGRLDVAGRIAQKYGDFIGSAEFFKRRLLWAKTDEERQGVLNWEPLVIPGAILQAVGEIFNITVGVKQLVLCEVPDAEGVRIRSGQIVPGMPTVIRDLAAALEAVDRHECLYLTDSNNVRLAIRESGVEFGKVMVMSELSRIFRIVV